jgi:L-lactate dehydrogenase complex protein LldG
MNVSPAKENMLKKIRKALTQSTPIPFPNSEGNSSVFQPSSQELELEFAEQFSRLLGKFAYCTDTTDLVKQVGLLITQQEWKNVYCQEEKLATIMAPAIGNKIYHTDLASSDVAFTGCECLIARTGSIVLSSGQASGRTTSVYAPIHICIAGVNQLVYDIRDGLLFMKEKYGAQLPSVISLATGPSRTADIEKTLVVGVHGPKEVYLFLVEDLPSF